MEAKMDYSNLELYVCSDEPQIDCLLLTKIVPEQGKAVCYERVGLFSFKREKEGGICDKWFEDCEEQRISIQ